jgi:hypothetical protein
MDLKVGWFFVNGRKQKHWIKYLKNKYPNEFKKSNHE